MQTRMRLRAPLRSVLLYVRPDSSQNVWRRRLGGGR